MLVLSLISPRTASEIINRLWSEAARCELSEVLVLPFSREMVHSFHEICKGIFWRC
jgi:hypothetical protein